MEKDVFVLSKRNINIIEVDRKKKWQRIRM